MFCHISQLGLFKWSSNMRNKIITVYKLILPCQDEVLREFLSLNKIKAKNDRRWYHYLSVTEVQYKTKTFIKAIKNY